MWRKGGGEGFEIGEIYGGGNFVFDSEKVDKCIDVRNDDIGVDFD